jgi:Family of unknown function (DUF6093)
MKLLADAHMALMDWMGAEYCEGNMIGSIKIFRKQAPVFDPVTGKLTAQTDTLIYQGKARIATVSGPLTYQLGDEPQYFSAATVSIPEDFTPIPQVDDVIEVVAHPAPGLVGRSYRVTDVQGGGQIHSARVMSVTGVQPGKNAT